MTDRQNATNQAFERIQSFGKTHATDFPTGSRGAASLTIIGNSVAGLKNSSAQPGTSASPATEQKVEVIDSLREDLKAIARTARAIEEADGGPGFATPYTLPRDRSNRDLIAAARSFLITFEKDAALAAHFIAYEIPDNFVADLRSDLADFDAATSDQAEDRSEGVGDTTSTREHFKLGKAALLQLSAIAQNKYRTQPALLAAWRTAAHIDRAASSPNPPEQPTPPSPATL